MAIVSECFPVGLPVVVEVDEAAPVTECLPDSTLPSVVLVDSVI